MEDLEQIDDEYKNDFEKIVEIYSKEMAEGVDKNLAHEHFKKELDKLIQRRNKKFLKYLDKNKDKILESPDQNQNEKKKKKKSDFEGVLDIRKTSINRNFFIIIWDFIKAFWFNIIVFFKWKWYNGVPSFFKYLCFRFYFILKGFILDILLIFKKIWNNIKSLGILIYENGKKIVIWIYEKLKIVLKFLLDLFKKIKGFFGKKKGDVAEEGAGKKEGEKVDEEKKEGEDDKKEE